MAISVLASLSRVITGGILEESSAVDLKNISNILPQPTIAQRGKHQRNQKHSNEGNQKLGVFPNPVLIAEGGSVCRGDERYRIERHNSMDCRDIDAGNVVDDSGDPE